MNGPIAQLLRWTDERVLVLGPAAEPTAQAVAAHLPTAQIEYATGSAPLPYPAAWFDVVLLEGALDFSPDPVATLAMVNALLAPDGRLATILQARDNLNLRLRALAGEQVQVRRWRRREALRSFTAAGYDVTSFQPVWDESVPWTPLPLDGRTVDLAVNGIPLQGLRAEDLEELAARAFVLTARRAVPDTGIECSIVIPVYNNLELTRKCIETLLDEPPEATHEVIVVDNGSWDGTRRYLQKLGDRIRLVGNARNLGFARACNEGVSEARGDFVVLLNNDTVPHKGWLDSLVDTAHGHAGVGAVGAKLLYPTGTIQHAGLAFSAGGAPYHLYRHDPADAPHVNRPRPMPGVTGACMLVPRRTFVRIGGLDERFFNGFEDVDFCLRLRAHGLTIHYCPASVLTHVESATERPRDDVADNVGLFSSKWPGLRGDDEAICRRDGTDVNRARKHAEVSPGLAPKTRNRDPNPAPIVWTGFPFERHGYAEEARSFLTALDRADIAVFTQPLLSAVWQTTPPPELKQRIERLARAPIPRRFVNVVHWEPMSFRRRPYAALDVGRTMFETDRIPRHWVERCNQMDEIWVPSAFNLETFARAGVDPERLHKIPEGIDTGLYHGSVEPLALDGVRSFVFLSVFDWSLRKGWDVLLRAYVEEFGADEDVTLVLKFFSRQVETMAADVDLFIRRVLGRDPKRVPQIVLTSIDPGVAGMPGLYRAADAFVMPSRGEGWGRPYMEAMAVGLPTIGTRWSGNLEFMKDENSYLLDHELVDVQQAAWTEIAGFYDSPEAKPDGRGHRWAEPSHEHLRQLMRRVVDHPEEAAAKGERARKDIAENYTLRNVAEAVVERLENGGPPPLRVPRAPRKAPAVLWEGLQFTAFGMAVVNRELCLELSHRVSLRLAAERTDHVDERLAPLASLFDRPLAGHADVHVRSSWPPRFDRPSQGKLVVVLPWELGSAPRAWVEAINRDVDELWVPSSFSRDCYVESGVDSARVVVVPNGVDPERYRPDAPPLELGTEKSTKFLFVGGTIARKGPDILLETYLDTFTRDDDVCLVVKDLGTDSFYAGQTLRARLEQAQTDTAGPEVIYLPSEIPDGSMPSLYTACDCLVAPYRGEGFGLPIAEAMACGLPVIVPADGACLDFCDPTVAYLVPAERVRFEERSVGGLETVDFPSWLEVDRGALAEAMRRVARRPEESRALGQRASEKVRRELTWAHAAGVAVARLEELTAKPTRVQRRLPAPRAKQLSVAMIVRDEERILRRALESVKDVADELVVVDTGSRDGTVDIAREFGARVFHQEWKDDFATPRNESIDRSTKDWVLVLEADQELDAGSHAELRRLIQTDELVGYMLRQFNYVDAQAAEPFVEHLNLRLFPNHPDLRYVGRVHEQLLPSRSDLAFRVEPCGVIVHHHGTRPGFSDPLAKAKRDAKVLKEMLREEPENAFHAFNLGIAYRVLERRREARRELERAVSLCKGKFAVGVYPQFILTAHLELAKMLLERGHGEKAAAWCRRAIALAPDFADASALLGSIHAGCREYETALRCYERAIESAGRPAYTPTDRSLSGWPALLAMGEIYLLLGRFDRALDALGRARALEPENRLVLARIAQAWQESGRTAEADALLRQAGVTPS